MIPRVPLYYVHVPYVLSPCLALLTQELGLGSPRQDHAAWQISNGITCLAAVC